MNPWHHKFNGKDVVICADPHFSHKNYCAGESEWSDTTNCRQFNTIHEMNKKITENLNKYYRDENQTLFILGDFAFGNKSKIGAYRQSLLYSKIMLIFGNHDTFIRKDLEAQSHFTACLDYLECYIEGRFVVMQHYAPRVWNRSHKQSYALFGHSHNSLPDDPNALSLEVGLDTSYPQYGVTKNLEPYTWPEIQKIMSKKSWKQVDHHNKNTNP